MKSIAPALIFGAILALLVFAARCSQKAMHDYETRESQGNEGTMDDPNSAPNDLAEQDRMAAAFPDTLLSTSGMRFKILRAGQGGKPIAGSTVRIHFVARLLDGTEITDQLAPAEPVTLVLLKTQTPRGMPGPVRGLDMALMEMRVGEKRLIVLPSPLAYGHEGHLPRVPPRAPLAIEVELLGFE